MGTTTQERPPKTPPAAKPVVSLRAATKAYGPNKALTDVNLDLRAGEVMCLAGENGAGKSTLIKILTGAVTRDSGDYLIDASEVGSQPPLNLDPGAVVADKANMGSATVKPLLNPPTAKAS